MLKFLSSRAETKKEGIGKRKRACLSSIQESVFEGLTVVIKEKSVNGMQVLILIGKLDIFSRNSFRDVVENHKKAGTKGLIIDLQGVTFIDSVGIGALVVAGKTFQTVKGKVILANPQDAVKSALDAMNLSALLPIFVTDNDYSKFSQPA